MIFVGDSTKFGNLPPHPAVYEALKRAIDSSDIACYGHSYGLDCARKAVAEAFTSDEHPLTYNVKCLWFELVSVVFVASLY